jgi:hypothetical protein
MNDDELVFGVRPYVFLDVLLENNPDFRRLWLDRHWLANEFADRDVELEEIGEFITKFKEQFPNFQELPEALLDAELDLFVALERHVDTVD